MHYRFVKVLVLLFLCLQFTATKAQEIDHWESLVLANNNWHYSLGTAEPDANWTLASFDPSAWSVGIGGIGYGDNDDGTEIEKTRSLYLRTSFTVQNTSNVVLGLLHVDYDDGFVAYLNGVEIARANMNPEQQPPTHLDFATALHEAQLYSGGKPEQFLLHTALVQKLLVAGENVLALQVHNDNDNSSDLSSAAFFSLGFSTSDRLYNETPSWFSDPTNKNLNLPIIAIDTQGQTIANDPKITARMKVINNANGATNNVFDTPTDYDGYIGIEIRGQSSQMFPKKSFTVETRNELGEGIDVSLLGLPEEEDWVLYAPYADKTLLRNALTYQIGAEMGRWQPHYKYCEVYMNGTYHGVYILIEKIKRDKNRLDISKLQETEISGDDLTGGYIVKVDKIGDVPQTDYFYTSPNISYHNARNYAFSYVYPKADNIVTQQKNYISSFLVEFETVLNSTNFTDPENGYRKYIDVPSFIDFQIINELTNNVDGYRYSTFFHKTKDSKGGKLFAGPLWDFNLGYGNVDFWYKAQATTNWMHVNYGPTEDYPMHWWARLMEDPSYEKQWSVRWHQLRKTLLSRQHIDGFLNQTVSYLGEAVERNFDRWPVLGQYVWPNYFVGNTYQQELDYMQNWIYDRLEWMDVNIAIVTGVAAHNSRDFQFKLYPNPVVDDIVLEFGFLDLGEVDVAICDLSGRYLHRSKLASTTMGQRQFTISNPQLKAGTYIIKASQNGSIIGAHKFLVK